MSQAANRHKGRFGCRSHVRSLALAIPICHPHNRGFCKRIPLKYLRGGRFLEPEDLPYQPGTRGENGVHLPWFSNEKTGFAPKR